MYRENFCKRCSDGGARHCHQTHGGCFVTVQIVRFTTPFVCGWAVVALNVVRRCILPDLTAPERTYVIRNESFYRSTPPFWGTEKVFIMPRKRRTKPNQQFLFTSTNKIVFSETWNDFLKSLFTLAEGRTGDSLSVWSRRLSRPGLNF